MRITRTIIIALFSPIAFTTCNKAYTDQSQNFSIEGSWMGKIETGSSLQGKYELKIKPGGTIERIASNGSVSASGKWNMNGDNFTASYSYANGTIVNIKGTINRSGNKLKASWQNSTGEEGSLNAGKQ